MNRYSSPWILFTRLVLRSRLPVPLSVTSGLPLRVRNSAWAAAAILFAWVTVGLVVLAGTGSRLYEMPEFEALIDLFFRATFVPLMFLVVAGFIASLRTDTARVREHTLLGSLPLSDRDRHRLFLVSSICRSIWLPIGMVLLLSTLVTVTPVPFIVRMNTIALIAYVALHLVDVVAHLAISLRVADAKRVAFPARSITAVALATTATYAAVPVVTILYPYSISGGSFWGLVGGSMTLIVGLFLISQSLFGTWCQRAGYLKARSRDGRPARFSYRSWSTVVDRAFTPGKGNPLLIKNLVRSSREESLSSGVILGLLFVAVAFLVAMNNDRIDDAVTVLSGIFSLYAFFVVTRAMSRLGADEEPTAILYSVPLTRAQLYFSVFVPLVAWLLAIAATLGMMVILAGGGMLLAWRFLSIAGVMLLLFGSMGISVAIAHYPRGKDAINRFLAWLLVVAVCVVVLYPFRAIVVMAAVGLSLLPLRRKRLFRN